MRITLTAPCFLHRCGRSSAAATADHARRPLRHRALKRGNPAADLEPVSSVLESEPPYGVYRMDDVRLVMGSRGGYILWATAIESCQLAVDASTAEVALADPDRAVMLGPSFAYIDRPVMNNWWWCADRAWLLPRDVMTESAALTALDAWVSWAEVRAAEEREAAEAARARHEEDMLIEAAEAQEAERRRRERLVWAKNVIAGTTATNARPALSRDVRYAVWERDGGACVECGDTFELQFDHVIPVAFGGASSIDNLQVLCGPCNRRKSASLG